MDENMYLREQWLNKLQTQERDLMRQYTTLRDRLRQQLNSGLYVEAGHTQMQLREVERELQKVSDQVSVIHRGEPVYWEE